ncbi:MAG: type I methionyl aminopeptidase [Parcubacteria group bacterium]
MIEIKTKEEIEIMKEGGRRHAAILSTLVSMVRPGLKTEELEDKARELIEEGGDKAAFLNYTPQGASRPFPAALCVSVNEEIVHGIPNEGGRVLMEGDIVTLDLGLIHKGFITDSAVTVGVGIFDEEAEQLIHIAKRALDAGVRAAIGGGHIGDIGAAIGKVVEGTGFALAEDLAGHGVGYRVHEDPYVPNTGKAGTGDELVPGMVIAIEPMVNVGTGKIKLMKDGYTIVTRDGKRSAHFEHTVAITEKGNIILTQH